MRHEILDRWLREKRSIAYVMEYLKDANFDPEFYVQFEEDIVSHYNALYGASITSSKKSWKRIFSPQ